MLKFRCLTLKHRAEARRFSDSPSEERSSSTVLISHSGWKLSGSQVGRAWRAHLESVRSKCCSGRGSCRLLRALSRQVLSISIDRDYTTSLGNLLKCLMTLITKRDFLVFRWNFLLVMSLVTSAKSLDPFSSDSQYTGQTKLRNFSLNVWIYLYVLVIGNS